MKRVRAQHLINMKQEQLYYLDWPRVLAVLGVFYAHGEYAGNEPPMQSMFYVDPQDLNEFEHLSDTQTCCLFSCDCAVIFPHGGVTGLRD